ncbi:MAG: DNA polymerase III subunit delta [Tannerellaceae bacterium]|jgi:DNA polymerase-3 subunit delta|nr:DNA polymerase III subunit delta [Tannerellaceae bacterium]
MKNLTFESIVADIKHRKFATVYILMGEEAYFIDAITTLLLEEVVKSEDKDFNQIVLYGGDVSVGDVLNAVRRYPVMAERQLVVVREAQQLKDIETLAGYVKKPLESTILVLNYKYKVLDRRKMLASAAEANGVLFESKKVPEYQLVGFIHTLLKGYGIEIEAKASQMLADHIGNDLTRLGKEVGKLRMLLKEEKTIRAETVEAHVGISKEYNNFELLRAIIQRNNKRAYTIAKYFSHTPKNNPIQATLAVLFNYFSNLICCHYAEDRTEGGLMTALGFRQSFQVKDYVTGMRNYSAKQVVEAIDAIRVADGRSKGVDNNSVEDGELLKELIYRILH